MVHLPSFPLSMYTKALSPSGPWGHEVTISLSSFTRALQPHLPPLGPQLPFSSGLGIWSLLAGGIPALCESLDGSLGCALCLVLSLYPFLSLLCPSVTVSCPVWGCQRVPLPVPPLPAVLRCSGAAPECRGQPLAWDHTWSCFAFPLGTASPGCCWTLLRCPV